MQRLTNPNAIYMGIDLRDYSDAETYAILPKVFSKLQVYEDIEEELGIDLLTLFKALKDGIYIKKQTQYTYPLALLRTHYSNHTTRYYVYDSGKEKEVKLKDYGKTWALTKEELEH